MILFSDLRQFKESLKNNGVILLQIVTSPIRKGGIRKKEEEIHVAISATNSERGRKRRQKRGQGRSQGGRGRGGRSEDTPKEEVVEEWEDKHVLTLKL